MNPIALNLDGLYYWKLGKQTFPAQTLVQLIESQAIEKEFSLSLMACAVGKTHWVPLSDIPGWETAWKSKPLPARVALPPSPKPHSSAMGVRTFLSTLLLAGIIVIIYTLKLPADIVDLNALVRESRDAATIAAQKAENHKIFRASRDAYESTSRKAHEDYEKLVREIDAAAAKRGYRKSPEEIADDAARIAKYDEAQYRDAEARRLEDTRERDRDAAEEATNAILKKAEQTRNTAQREQKHTRYLILGCFISFSGLLGLIFYRPRKPAI